VVVVGWFLALVLVALGAGTVLRQRRTLRRLRDDRFLPGEDRAYLRGQVRRRVVISVLLVAVGGMIVGYYASGMDARLDAIGERKRADDPDRSPEQDEADKAFAKQVGYYWIGILGLLFAAVCVAVFDFWATRRYWMAQYKRIKTDHDTKLRRDLAVYRQQKDNDRMNRLRRRGQGGDPDDTPSPDE
jgi:hypothetical protein